MTAEYVPEKRMQMLMACAGDPNSAWYAGAMRILRDCEATDRRARSVQKSVTIPFELGSEDFVALQDQFSVQLRKRGLHNRARLSVRVAAMVHIVDASLMEHAGGGGRRVLAIDYDLATAAAVGLGGVLIERSHATARLQAGYALEDEYIRNQCLVKGKKNLGSYLALRAEVVAGGGEHFHPALREDGPQVDSIVVNHFKTPVGLDQVAWFSKLRGAVVYGCFPFQVEMVYKDSGPLAAFPGRFYVDRANDFITLVPSDDASMSISHSYSLLMSFVDSNAVTVGEDEFVCEKYLTVRGMLYYTVRALNSDFEAPEVLRSSFYDSRRAVKTVLRYPKAKLSSEGVPVGWERGEVTMLTTRFDRVVSRLMTSRNAVIDPTEVLVALVDYNNSVVNTLDTAVAPERMPVEDEFEAALAIALYLNYRRGQLRGTFNVMLDAVKRRYGVKDKGAVSVAILALSAWWSGGPKVENVGVVEELPHIEVVNWLGEDFSVLSEGVEAWLDVDQTVGAGSSALFLPLVDHFPKPPRAYCPVWFNNLVRGVRSYLNQRRLEAQVSARCFAGGRYSSSKSGGAMPSVVISPPEGSGVVSVVTLNETVVPDQQVASTPARDRLRALLSGQQMAFSDNPPDAEVVVVEPFCNDVLPSVPVAEVDPYSSITADLEALGVDPLSRDPVVTGYRLAEVDIVKNVEGNLVVNDARRNIPGQRWVRKPKIFAGVEGKRVSSQAALLGAVFKRNVGIPPNRGEVNLDTIPDEAVSRLVSVCFREDWKEVLERHLNAGLWEFNEPDIERYVAGLPEKKMRDLLETFFVEGDVDLSRWLLMAKGKVKASREADAADKVDHSQTIMYLEDGAINAAYSAQTKRFKKVLDECFRPGIALNTQNSPEEHESWYNSLEALRKTFLHTFSYGVDAKSFDRSQEAVGLKCRMRLYAMMGLNRERLRIWSEMHGPKRAVSLMFGLVLVMTQGGVSGSWETLLRNGLIMMMAVVVSSGVTRGGLVMLDVKGDDVDMETSKPLDVDATADRMSLTFNLSSKFFTNDVRYMCKDFRIKVAGRWYFVADPWARVQSACTPLWIGNHEDVLKERWISLKSDLRHYDNGILVDAVAEAAQQYYGMDFTPYGMARGLSALCRNFRSYAALFDEPELVG